MPPPPFGSVGRGTLAGEKGGGGVPIQTRGHIYCGTLYIYVLFCDGKQRGFGDPLGAVVSAHKWMVVGVGGGMGGEGG